MLASQLTQPSINSSKKPIGQPPTAQLQKEVFNNAEKILIAIGDLDSNDVNTVIRGLNILTQRSFDDYHGFNFDTYPQAVTALGDLLEVINPFGSVIATESCKDITDLQSNPMCRDISWKDKPPLTLTHAVKVMAKTIDENLLLLSTLNIIRNLSFEASNEGLIAQSAVLMRHLVSLLLPNLGGNIVSEASSHAFDILANISSKVDLNGRKRQQIYNFAWLEDVCSLDTKSKTSLRVRMSSHMGPSSAGLYLSTTEALLTFILITLEEPTDKSQILHSLDILTKLASNSENGSIFARCPQGLLEALVQLLCVNFTAADPFTIQHGGDGSTDAPSTAMRSIGPRPPASMGTFFIDSNDMEIRDSALEAMQALLANSYPLQLRLAAVPHCLQLLVRIVATNRAHIDRPFSSIVSMPRSESGPQRAAGVLALMSSRPENKPRFLSIRTELAAGACSGEDYMADAVGGHNMRIFNMSSVPMAESVAAAMAVDPSSASFQWA